MAFHHNTAQHTENERVIMERLMNGRVFDRIVMVVHGHMDGFYVKDI
jgi:hypothetical protein